MTDTGDAHDYVCKFFIAIFSFLSFFIGISIFEYNSQLKTCQNKQSPYALCPACKNGKNAKRIKADGSCERCI